MGRDKVVGIGTGYGMDCSGGGGEIFHARPDRSYGPPSLLDSVYRVSFPGIKQSERALDYPPYSSVEVKERVKMYLF